MNAFDTTMQLAGAAMIECLATERVTYTPVSGTPRTIDVIIQREAVVDNVPTARIEARHHATLGLDGAAVDTGGDTITWRPKGAGAVPRVSRIIAVPTVNAGIVVVEVA